MKTIYKPKHRGILCNKWTIQSQVLVFTILLSTLIVAIFTTLGILLFKQTTTILIESSQYLLDSITNQQLQRYMNLQQHSIELNLQDSQRNLLATNHLYHLAQNQTVTTNSPPYDCLDNPQSNDSYAYTLSFCYMFCNKQANPQNQKDLLTLTSLLTQSLSIWNFDTYYYIADNSTDEYFTMHAGDKLIGYRFQIRPWYQDHLKQLNASNQPSIYTNPYLSSIGIVYTAQTANLTYLNESFAGVVGDDVSLARLPQIMDPKVNLLVTNSSGYLILCKWYDQGLQDIITVSNQSITGFNITNWIVMKEQLAENSQSIRIYNSLLQQDVLVTVSKMKYPKYFIIIYRETQSQDEDQRQLTEALNDFEHTRFQQIGIELVIVFTLSLIFPSIIIASTLRPVKQLSQITKQRIYDKFTPVKQVLYKAKGNTIVENLLKAYDQMIYGITNRKRKETTLNTMSKITYPQKYVDFKVQCVDLKDQQWQISDQMHCWQCFQLIYFAIKYAKPLQRLFRQS